MRRATWLVAIGAALALTSVQSASAESLTNSQQEKMKECNADATTKSLSGDERKAFMKTCLSKTGRDTVQQSAAENEGLQRGSNDQVAERGQPQGVHEDLSLGRLGRALEPPGTTRRRQAGWRRFL